MTQSIQSFEFVTEKYGDELLVDVGSTDELPGFQFHRTPHQLMFFDVLLLRSGRGHLLQEDRRHAVAPNSVAFLAPGEQRRWIISGDAEGLVLFFTAEFLLSFLSDTWFVQKLPFFRPGGPRVLQLNGQNAAWLERQLDTMRQEVTEPSWGHRLSLQASTYSVLVWLLRKTTGNTDQPPQMVEPSWFQRFVHCVEDNFRIRRRTVFYAKACGVSTSHLSALVRSHTGHSVGQFVQARVLREARKELLHSTRPVAEIAARCGFADPSYFCRYFKRAVGYTPMQYRTLISEKC